MGAISKIRQLSPLALAIFAVLFIAFMVIGDSSCSSISQQSRQPENISIAEVNGENIPLIEYEARVKEFEERTRQSGQEVDSKAVRQQVYDLMVSEVLRRQQANELGLVLTDEEIIDVMLINPPADLQFFKDSTGRFQKELYQDLVTNPAKISEMMIAQGATAEQAEQERVNWVNTLTQIEDGLRTQKIEEALRVAVGAAASIPSPAMAEEQYMMQNSTASVRYIAIPADLVSDEAAPVTDAEIEAYYEKNKQYFEQRPARGIKYVTLRQEASDKDSARAVKRSQKLMSMFGTLPTVAERDSAFSKEMLANGGQTFDFQSGNDIDPALLMVLKSLPEGDVFGPLNLSDGIRYIRLDGMRDGETPVVRASHILINFDAGKDESKSEATAIMNRAKRGEDFGDLARQYSKDPGSGQNGGDLSFFGKGRMVAPFEEAAFAASVGEIVGPVETQFGWHIIKVTDRQTSEIKYSEIVIKPVMSNATLQQNIVRASKIEERITDGMSIDSVAADEGLDVNESPVFQRNTPFLNTPRITAWAFEADKGEVLRTTVDPYGIIIATLTEVRQAGIKPLIDVTDEIKRRLMQVKKLDNLKILAKQVADACMSAGSMDAYRQVDSTLELRTMPNCLNNGQLQGFGGEFAATNAAFTTPLNKISSPVRGDRAWFVLTVDSRTPANAEAFTSNMTQFLQNQTQRARTSAYYTWLQAVRDNSEIIDLRDSRN